MLVATKKIMSRQFLEAEVHKELGTTKFVLRHKTLLSRQEQTAASKLYCDIIKVCRDKIQEKAQRTGHDRKLHAATEASDKE